LIFTIGYAGPLTTTRLLEVATALDALVIDVRSRPQSRKPGFSKTKLGGLLGDRYLPMGHLLGGRPPGVLDEGIAQVRALSAKRDVILMCMEETPEHCHRHHTICAPHFPRAIHIFEDDLVAARDLETALVTARKTGELEYDLLGSFAELVKDPKKHRKLLARLVAVIR
jgi:uncharacterized protein (DUF488 family)